MQTKCQHLELLRLGDWLALGAERARGIFCVLPPRFQLSRRLAAAAVAAFV